MLIVTARESPPKPPAVVTLAAFNSLITRLAPAVSDQAKLAVQIVINYEEGAENCVLHAGDTHSEVKPDYVCTSPTSIPPNPNVCVQVQQ